MPIPISKSSNHHFGDTIFTNVVTNNIDISRYVSVGVNVVKF